MEVNYLRKIREQRNISMEELSILSGVSVRTIRSYELNERDINHASAISVLNLAKVLRCNPWDLLGMENQQQNIYFGMEKVYERDVDLLISESFINDEFFKDIFLKLINYEGYNLVSIEHSVVDNQGESDLRVMLEKDSNKIALLIEDKIDAIAMPNQYQRYCSRGNRGLDEGLYDEFYIFMIAPQDYLTTNSEANKYPYKISYEELLDYYKDNNTYAYNLINSALERKKKGYSVIEDKEVTEFWRNYYIYVENNYPLLRMYKVDGPRGSNATWPAFLFGNDIKIQHKSDRGYLDLQFPKVSKYEKEFYEIANKIKESDMSIEKTGKSLSIRLHIPIIDFKKDFNTQLEQMKETMDKAMRFYELMNKPEIDQILELINRG